MTIKGFDASSYQHPNGAAIDFSKAKAAGYEFVLIKATEGVGYTNPFFKKDVHAAHEAGFAVGAYTFLRADTDAVAAANKLNEVLNETGVRLELPLTIDFEPGESGNPTHHQLDTVRTVLRQHGHKTMTYSYADFIKEHVPSDCKFCASDPLWLAAYQAKEPAAPKPFGKVTIWQKTSRADIPGVVSAGEDADVFLGDEAHFDVFIGRKKPPATLPSWYHRLLEYPPSKLRPPGHTQKITYFGGKTVEMQEGDDVRHVQRKLGIKPDGLFGPTTANHVKGFQRMHKLNPDGIVGPETAKRIGE